MVSDLDEAKLAPELKRRCRVYRRGIFFFCDAGGFGGFSHEPDLFQLGFLEPEKGGHLGNLAGINKIVRVGTELFNARAKLATAHCLWNVQSKHAFAVLPVMRTEFTNYHTYLNLDVSRRGLVPQALSAPKQRRTSY